MSAPKLARRGNSGSEAELPGPRSAYVSFAINRRPNEDNASMLKRATQMAWFDRDRLVGVASDTRAMKLWFRKEGV